MPAATTRALLAITLGVAALTPIASADDLFVGSPQGVVLRADATEGNFQFGGVCGGPINSMALSAHTLMIGDHNGNVYGLNVDEGGVSYYFTLQNSDNTAIIPHNNTLLISSLNGTVRRVNPLTGQLLATYTSPVPIRAMARDDNFLYVGGSQSGVYRASLSDGVFSYFACVCLGPINSIAVVAEEILAGDINGTVMRFDRGTGLIVGGFSVQGDNTAMAATPAGDLFITDSTGHVRRVNPEFGDVLAEFNAGITINSLVLVGAATCTADFNQNGTVDSADFFSFLNSFLGNKITTDMNRDGQVTSQDFFDFITAFFTPCI